MMRIWARAAGVGVLLAAAPALGAAPADAASYDCTTRTTVKSFAAWGDQNDYFLVPDGSFENGAASWTVSLGVASVLGNQPWNTVAGPNARSLWLPAGGSAETPTMCVASNEDSVRFMYRSPGVPGSILRASVRVKSSAGDATYRADLSGSTAGWAVSPRIMLPNVRDAAGRQYTSITFTTAGIPAGWQLDDVQVDPWRTL